MLDCQKSKKWIFNCISISNFIMSNIPIHTGKESNDHFWVSFRCLVEQLWHSLLHWMYLTYNHFELRPSTGIPILFDIFSHFQPKNSYVQKQIVECWMKHLNQAHSPQLFRWLPAAVFGNLHSFLMSSKLLVFCSTFATIHN